MSRLFGFRVERAAERYLRARGLIILRRNYAARGGEIDIIAQDGGCLVFVEVRYRDEWETAAVSVDYKKRRRIERTAHQYMSSYDDNMDYRFDIIAVGSNNKIEWIKQAF